MAPTVVLSKRQNCYPDSFGRCRYSSGFSNGARIGTGIAIAVAIIILILIIGLLGRRRRRRMASNTQPVFTTQPTQGYNGGGDGSQYAAYYGGQPGDTGYGQQGQAYGGANQGYGYPPTSGDQAPYSPPAGPPPGAHDGYEPPSMPPPSYQKGGEK